jgi:lysozyme family protein
MNNSPYFQIAYPLTNASEGGYVNDPSDPGGETIFGITKRVAEANGYAGSMRSMTPAACKAIYEKCYWDINALDEIAKVSQSIANEMFDTGVLMGPAKEAKWLQEVLNGLNENGSLYSDLQIDGKVGPATARALATLIQHRGPNGVKVVLALLNALQAADMVRQVEATPTKEKYLFGWILNRVVNNG